LVGSNTFVDRSLPSIAGGKWVISTLLDITDATNKPGRDFRFRAPRQKRARRRHVFTHWWVVERCPSQIFPL